MLEPTKRTTRQGPHWAWRLRRHLGWVLAIKIAFIALLFAFFFSGGQRPDIDAGEVSDRLQLHR
ncbi:cytochrome oxidase putative small subunit CydP [Marilutibacter alkalisoli]|uniref:Uncharacterized protein n=1 Tax=Marilutibacter alkalisoli TaxID=2591633 RepID=A0A514BP91_9GAMM|nr:cytochrome oxidase putative small subunit CydP [Lysobacter alkalisoli]QDH69200.1 hypothetical protein FKV23_03130 [Lysobacter alkalisoli]